MPDVQSEPRVNARTRGAAREGGYARCPMFRRALPLLLLILPSCVDGELLADVFCGSGEACLAVVEPPPVVCGGVECPATKCNVGWTCDGNDCISKGDPAGYDDHDECTEDVCDDATGQITHRAYTSGELDDGNPCTEDQCHKDFGIVHGYSCSDVCNDPQHCG